MDNKHWFGLHIDLGELEGTHTIETFDTLSEARNSKKQRVKRGEYLEKDLHIDEWKNTDNPEEVRTIE